MVKFFVFFCRGVITPGEERTRKARPSGHPARRPEGVRSRLHSKMKQPNSNEEPMPGPRFLLNAEENPAATRLWSSARFRRTAQVERRYGGYMRFWLSRGAGARVNFLSQHRARTRDAEPWTMGIRMIYLFGRAIDSRRKERHPRSKGPGQSPPLPDLPGKDAFRRCGVLGVGVERGRWSFGSTIKFMKNSKDRFQ